MRLIPLGARLRVPVSQIAGVEARTRTVHGTHGPATVNLLCVHLTSPIDLSDGRTSCVHLHGDEAADFLDAIEAAPEYDEEIAA